ncbi:MAG: hypothetical protein SF123_19210 [Chloroflexota bacterium]|nr:hypothetical protein [Chloroflexota bacterium]
MGVFKAIGGSIKNFMILFSFIVNLILIIVLIVLLLLIFEIKNQIATPLVSGLHSSFVGLDQATIDWTIPVRERVPVVLDVPVNLTTTVVLTDEVALNVPASVQIEGSAPLGAVVSLNLPVGLELPVSLNFILPLNQELPVNLDVRAVIPLEQTQLHDPFENLRLMFEPLAVALHNLPNGFNEVPGFVGNALDADGVNLLAPNAYSQQPWPGFSNTAGVGYSLGTQPWPAANIPADTGMVPLGGIPALDQQLRPEVWAAGGPQAVNAAAMQAMTQNGVPAWAYGASAEGQPPLGPDAAATVAGQPGAVDTTQSGDMGIMPTPTTPGS